MSFDLLKKVQENLVYPVLQKMDANTQERVADESKPDEDKFSQAAIPSVLIGLYQYVQNDKGVTTLLDSDTSSKWFEKIFTDTKKEAIEKI